MKKFLLFLSLLLLVVVSCDATKPNGGIAEAEYILEDSIDSVGSKIKGVSMEMPGNPMGQDMMATVKEANSEWVALIPYGYTREGQAKVNFNYGGSWWGESVEGTVACAQFAKNLGLKTMLKPHVWVVGQGWPGDFDLKSEKEWKIWEESYRTYILAMANVADSMEVDLFCIGTEYRHAVVKRSAFWEKLIDEVRTIYKGDLTYASNWDNFHKVKFWDKLDVIGVDAYFPLSEAKEPSVDEMIESWQVPLKQLKALSEKKDRDVLFTEYGYKSIDYVSAGHWNYNEDTIKVNVQNQVNAYESLFQSVWQEDWMLGGFFWKWHFYADAGGLSNRRYTPQGKPCLETIRKWYGKP